MGSLQASAMPRSLSRRKLLWALWALAVLVELAWLFSDLILPRSTAPTTLRGTSTPIAELSSTTRDVRVRAPGGLVWETAPKGSLLTKHQELQTLAGARAEVTFLAGTGFELGESSWVEIEETGGTGSKLVVKLLRGELRKSQRPTGRGSKPIELQLGSQKLTLDAETQIRARMEAASDSAPASGTIEVEGGTLAISGTDGTTTTLKSGDHARVPAVGQVEVTNATPAPVSSPAPAPVTAKKKRPPALQAAPKPDPAEPPAPPDELQDGVFRPAPGGPRARLWIRALWALSSLIPSAHADEPVKSWNVDLKWKAAAEAQRYRIQIAKDSQFKTVLEDRIVDAPSYSWAYRLGMENAEGKVFYRVASVGEDGKSGEFSNAKTVAIPKSILAPPPETYSGLDTTDAEADATNRAAEIVEPAPRMPWPDLSIWVPWGAGSLGQSSLQSGFESVSMIGIYPRQRYGLSVEYRDWRIQLGGGISRFYAAPLSRPVQQETITTWDARADVLKWKWMLHGWEIALGGTVERAFRWEKSNPQAVTATAGYGFGPAAKLQREFGSLTAEFQLGVPLTGFLAAGYFGIQGEAALEWRIVQKALGSRALVLALRAGAGANARRWMVPTGAWSIDWGAWVAPALSWLEVSPPPS